MDPSAVPHEHVVNREIILTERGAEAVLAAIVSTEIRPLPPALQALLRRGRSGR